MHKMFRCCFLIGFLIAGCSKKDNSADTDQASKDMRTAQAEVSEHSKDLAKNQDEIEQKKRELLREQQELASKQKLLEHQQQELGSAQGNLKEARVAYAAAVKERFAKLDASLATLATKTDAKSKDALAGLRARRDEFFTKVDAMATTPDPSWDKYTKDLDITFDAIEHDLREALH